MKNEVMTKPFPYNLFDDLGAKPPTEQPEDFLATLMYILRCVATPRDSRAILLRYKEGKTYDEIGETFDITKQRAHSMIQDILEKFNDQYIDMLTKGIKKYYEDLLEERLSALAPVISESEREFIELTAYEEGYTKGYADGLIGRKTSSAPTLDNIDLSTLQLSVRTFNALTKNGIKTLGDVKNCGDGLISLETFGKACFAEIADTLKTYGVEIEANFPACVKKWGIA